MSKNSIIDYSSCILFRLLSPLIRSLPGGLAMFLGRRVGDLFYYFDLRHKATSYANIKKVFGERLSPLQLAHLTRDFYRAFGQNIIEVLMIPLINKGYLNKYIDIQGLEHISEGFKRNKGVILLGVHEGSWELSNIICAILGFPFILFVRDQRYPRLNRLLNSYRRLKGCKIIQREGGIKQLLQALRDNQAIGMTLDQGGRRGDLVKFFGRDASMSTGAVRMGLKYGAAIIPSFYIRTNGPYIKIIIEPPFELRKTGDLKKDIHDNLQRLAGVFEKYIMSYPREYLWSYKIWKYSDERNILILDDARAGHLRQSQAVARIISGYLQAKGITARSDTVGINFRHKFSREALTFSSCLAGKYHCQGCLWCLKNFLAGDTYKALISRKPDIVISCGSSVAPVNFILSRENLAKSIVIMRPSLLSTARFDLVIMSKHDKPPRRRNVAVTEGALNLIDEVYLKEQSANLIKSTGIKTGGFYIALLIGGDTGSFSLGRDTVAKVIRQVKSASERLNADILVTTSRRTSREAEITIKEEFRDYSRCKLLVIANEKNIPEAVGGILGLSQVVVSSPESISMISEAINSKKYVLVFESCGLSRKHRRFLKYFAGNRYIYFEEPGNLSKRIEGIWLKKPPVRILSDNNLIREAIKRII